MKSFAFLVMPTALAIAMALSTAMPASAAYNIIQGQPKCDDDYKHCLYMKNAFTPGDKGGQQVVCTNIDQNGNGYGTCIFPAQSHTVAQCKQNSYVDVYFGRQHSSYRSSVSSDVKVQWSSQKNKGNDKHNDDYNDDNGDDDDNSGDDDSDDSDDYNDADDNGGYGNGGKDGYGSGGKKGDDDYLSDSDHKPADDTYTGDASKGGASGAGTSSPNTDKPTDDQYGGKRKRQYGNDDQTSSWANGDDLYVSCA